MEKKATILLVDDLLSNIKLIEAYLAPQGYEIITSTNGKDALKKKSENTIDMILLDVMMPGMDGFEVTRRIRKDNEDQFLPIILVTALRETEDRVKGIEAGCDDFISKPVDKIELLAKVRALLKVKAYNDLMSNYRLTLESEVVMRTEELKRTMERLAVVKKELAFQNEEKDKRAAELVIANKGYKQMELTSRTDSLTGLCNRRCMEQRIQEEYDLYQITGSEFALIIVDIDLFKRINDRYGHAGGDCLLKSISADLKKTVRKGDVVARWGGDEFLLLLPMTNVKNAVGLAKCVCKTVEKRKYAYENEVLSVTLTLGVSVIRRGDTVASIIKKADIVMYEGKRAGRNCVIYFNNLTNSN